MTYNISCKKCKHRHRPELTCDESKIQVLERTIKELYTRIDFLESINGRLVDEMDSLKTINEKLENDIDTLASMFTKPLDYDYPRQF